MTLKIFGSPFRGNQKANVFGDPMLDEISWRLDGWKKTYLSLGGRITLIQSCLSHFLGYFLCLYGISLVVVIKIEKMNRVSLLRGLGGKERPFSLVENRY